MSSNARRLCALCTTRPTNDGAVVCGTCGPATIAVLLAAPTAPPVAP